MTGGGLHVAAGGFGESSLREEPLSEVDQDHIVMMMICCRLCLLLYRSVAPVAKDRSGEMLLEGVSDDTLRARVMIYCVWGECDSSADSTVGSACRVPIGLIRPTAIEGIVSSEVTELTRIDQPVSQMLIWFSRFVTAAMMSCHCDWFFRMSVVRYANHYSTPPQWFSPTSSGGHVFSEG